MLSLFNSLCLVSPLMYCHVYLTLDFRAMACHQESLFLLMTSKYWSCIIINFNFL